MIQRICGHSFRHPVRSILPRILGCLLLIITIIPYMIHSILDCDVWWHMSCARSLLSCGTINYQDFYYSLVQNSTDCLRFTWLGDILLFLSYYFFGPIGLQLLRAEFIVIMLWCLWELSDKKLNFYKSFIFSIVCCGCYQLFLVRNSIFSLIFYPLIWVFVLKNRPIKCMMLLVLWSAIHGSYIFGIIMTVVIYICKTRHFQPKIILSFIVLVVLLNQIIPLQGYLTIPETLNLNGTIFKTSGPFISKDFTSPFELPRPYASICYLLSIFTMCSIKKPRILYILAFMATFIPALGYIRMLGYHSITCGCILLIAERNGDLRDMRDFYFLPVLFYLAYGSWINYGGFKGIGEADVYKEIYDAAYKEQVFATEDLTGYLYFRYRIRGYLDTFYAPHQSIVFEKYHQFLRYPDTIPEVINTCILNKRMSGAFYFSQNWELQEDKEHIVIFRRKEK